MDESRLDRIERILEETARITRETAALSKANEIRITAVSDAQDKCFVALQHLIEASELLFKHQDQLTQTLERLAQLWGRSPN